MRKILVATVTEDHLLVDDREESPRMVEALDLLTPHADRLRENPESGRCIVLLLVPVSNLCHERSIADVEA